MKLCVGVAGRFAFWLSLWFVVGNGVAQSFQDNEVGLAVAKIALFPITWLLWPFVAPDYASAWPLADGSGWFIPALAVGFVGYGLSTFVGELEPVE